MSTKRISLGITLYKTLVSSCWIIPWTFISCSLWCCWLIEWYIIELASLLISLPTQTIILFFPRRLLFVLSSHSLPHFFHATIGYHTTPPKIQPSFWKLLGVEQLIKIDFNYCTFISTLSTRTYFLCYANSESDERLFIRCLFSQQLWQTFFSWLILLGLVLHTIHGLVPQTSTQWRTIPLTTKPKSYRICASILWCRPFGKKVIKNSLKIAIRMNSFLGFSSVHCC